MERQLYFIKIPGRKGMHDIIIAAFSEVNAKAIAEECCENEVTEIRLCTLKDVREIEDKRIMHASHMMTPLDIEKAKRYGVK